MHEIILTQTNGNVTADSRMIAEHFEKYHKHVIEAIENLIEQTLDEISSNLFIPSTYADSYGRLQKNYQLTRDGFSLLVMGFTGARALDWKLRYIKAFNEMYEQLRVLKAPQTFAEALRLAADQAELIERQKPLIQFAETCARSESSILIRELAKIMSKDEINVGEKRLFQKLREWKLLMYNNEPYQEYIDRGYFEVTESCYENSKGTFLSKTTRVLPKGQQYIINRFLKEAGHVAIDN